MNPLITIETVPISIEYVEKKATHTSSQSASLRISQQDKKVMIQGNPIHLQFMDCFEPGPSTDLHNLSYTATAHYSDSGNIRMNIEMNDYRADTFQYDQVNRGIDNIIDIMPHIPSNFSAYGFESMQINFDMSQLTESPLILDNIDMSFLPPDLELKVIEQPKVIIKYIGGPIYIPKSSDPNYESPEDLNQVFDGKSNFDVKV
ncbi:MAG: hypothetical protein PHV71_02055 [Eubacteriales bacterium]|nr:hypothetical protein [Eubacteriales bacterium]MDD3199239.1 hypothetical protein [Eubacteriales bacterium]MDD4122156.1 hypothetical protein [Eubacteriales bacterium]MDD4629370.1 hypothetical protein [Eubacteriales bacterium]